LQIPLFGGVNSAKAKASEISISQSQLALDKSKLALNLQQQELHHNYEKQTKSTPLLSE
jgi:cobalt-zinc-cadmium efflux system outer membrane protein